MRIPGNFSCVLKITPAKPRTVMPPWQRRPEIAEPARLLHRLPPAPRLEMALPDRSQLSAQIISMWLCKLLLVEKSLTELSPHSKLVPIQIRKPISIAPKCTEMLIFLQRLTECILLFSISYNFAPVPMKDRPRFLSKMERTSALAQPIFFQDSLFPFSWGRLAQLSCSAQIFCSVWGGWGGLGR